GTLESGPRQCDHIHVALGHDQRLSLGDGGTGRADIVEIAALVEERVLGAVKIFRPCIRIHRTAAETDAAVPTVADRKDDPATEAAIGRPTVIGPGRKPRLDDL